MHINEKIRQLDNYKCRVWGCGSSQKLEVHHIIPRGKQGSDEPWNLITLCNYHHNLVTLGKLTITKILMKLVSKADFRWEKALLWHLNRNKIRKKI
jgi:5-methylcytosine-specific restriction endonuclease McrA